MKRLVAAHKLNAVMLTFLVLICSIHVLKPGLVYNKDGGFRPFGVGFRHKTILPIWLVVILVAIFSYCLVLGYLWFG